MNKQENIPALRFPEFTGNWVVKKLGEIVKINQGLQIAISERYTEQGDDTYFYITNEFLKEKSEKKYFIKNPPKSVICSKDDILMTRTGNTGMVVTGVEGAFHNNFFKVAYPSSIHKDYLCNFLKLNPTQVLISKLAGTSTIPDLNHSDFYKIQMPVPSFPEQQKIATFLSSVDEKLQGLKKKKSLLEAYKKGMMQRLFSSEPGLTRLEDEQDLDDNNPTILTSRKLRFRQDNGEDFPDWEEKTLGEVTEVFDGTHQTPEYLEEGIPFYSVEQLTANNFTKTKFISETVFEQENRRVRIERGDILMTRIGDIGTARYIDWDANASFYVSIVLIKQKDSFNSKYLNQFIGSTFFQKELWQRTIHVAFPKKINLGEISNCVVYFPTLPEQTKIANFLSAIDEKIAKVSQEIEQATVWKKGLLQQLFV